MWAQLITFRLKPDRVGHLSAIAQMIEAAEQPGSGLIREVIARDTKDPQNCFGFVVFESEAQARARARESDPRRATASAEIRELMGEALEGPPTFVDLEVVHEFSA